MSFCSFSPRGRSLIFFFFFNDTATTEIYTLSLHDALPISTLTAWHPVSRISVTADSCACCGLRSYDPKGKSTRSEEHTSELQSQSNLVCRLLLEKKKKRVILVNTQY